MKKVFMLLIASAALTMTACGGKKDEKAAATSEATSEQTPGTTEDAPVDPSTPESTPESN